MFFFAFCGGARIRPDLVQPWFVVVIVHFLIDRFHCLRFASDPLIETFSPYMSFKLLVCFRGHPNSIPSSNIDINSSTK